MQEIAKRVTRAVAGLAIGAATLTTDRQKALP